MSYSSNPEANGRFRTSYPRIILIYIHRRDLQKNRIIMRTVRGCSDKTPKERLFPSFKERDKEKERTSRTCEIFVTIVLHMYEIDIFSPASVIAQTVLIYIIYVHFICTYYLAMRARVLAIYLSAPRRIRSSILSNYPLIYLYSALSVDR